MEDVGYYNGKYDRIERMMIPMNDRVVYFGDGVYEATFVRNHRIFALTEHLNRLYRSLSLVEIPFTMSKEERKILTDMARKRSLKYSIENTFEKYLDLYKS